MSVQIDRDRLVDTASAMIGVHSFTGDEQSMAELMVSLYEAMRLAVQWQQVEEGRANALGTWQGTGCAGGPASSRTRSSGTAASTASASRT